MKMEEYDKFFQENDNLDECYCPVCERETIHQIMTHYRVCWYCDRISSFDGTDIKDEE